MSDNKTLQELKTAAAKLSQEQRAELAHFLLESLDSEDVDWEKAWEDELDRRLEEIQSGKAVGVPLEDVLRKLRIQYP